MEKKKYEEPMLEVLVLDTEDDLITTSVDPGGTDRPCTSYTKCTSDSCPKHFACVLY